MSTITILDHQVPILEQLANDRGKGKTLVVIPSGAGKTHIAAFDTKACKAKNILYIAHRREILKQAARIFQEIHGRGSTGFLDGESKDFDRPILFATNSTLARSENLEIISKRKWDYVIVDEFHHVAADTFSKILEKINTKFLLGLTATDYRLDKKDIMGFVDNNLSYKIDLETGIKKGILVPFHYNGLHDDVDYSDIIWQGNKYRESDLNKKLLIDKRDNQIVKEFLRLIGKGHQTIAFCLSIQHCQRMMERFKEEGISCRKIIHKTHLTERDISVRDFRDGKFDVLFVKDVFNEGVDFPNVEAILMLRPTWSKNVFYQQLGRGLRKAKGKTHVTVLDFIGNYNHAFDKSQWLEFAEKSESEMEHKPIKPLYEHNIPYVHFTQRVVDIFEYQKQFSRGATAEELKAEYFRMKKLLGRQPTSNDFSPWNATHEFKINFRASQFQWRYNGWNGFLKKIGEPLLKQDSITLPSKTELIEYFYSIARQTNKTPNSTDFHSRNKNLKYNWIYYAKVFGSWSKFLKEIGEPQKTDKKRLTELFFKVKKQLGRIPTRQELRKKEKTTFDRPNGLLEKHYSNYKNFLESLNESTQTMLHTKIFKCSKCGIISRRGHSAEYCTNCSPIKNRRAKK